MSVIAMLAILWWGLLGFASVVVSVWFFVGSLGQKGQLVLVIIVGLVGGKLLERYFTADERCANDFLAAWAAESADWPEGRVNTREISEFLDFDKIGEVNQYLAQQFRLRYHSSVRAAGEEDVYTKGSVSPVSAKVYLADVRIHGSEQDVDIRAKLRVWISKDSDKVVKFMFENIVFL